MLSSLFCERLVALRTTREASVQDGEVLARRSDCNYCTVSSTPQQLTCESGVVCFTIPLEKVGMGEFSRRGEANRLSTKLTKLDSH